ncbi:MAG: hypothetical protein K0U72_08365 [Gammaproteobacteria bacterium]|nr:hypothetical protein [Gammaproteobacteria bacterium]
MPGEVAFEFFAAIARFLSRVVFEIVFELLIQGTGQFILRTFRPKREPGEVSSAVVGLFIWVVIIWAGWAAYGNLRAAS